MTISQKKTQLLTIGLLVCLGLSFITAFSEFSTQGISQPSELNTELMKNTDFDKDTEAEKQSTDDQDQSEEKQEIDSTWYEGKTVQVDFDFKKHFPTIYDVDRIDNDDDLYNWENTNYQKQWLSDDTDNDEFNGLAGEILIPGYTTGTLYYNLTVIPNIDGGGQDTSVSISGTVVDPYTDASGNVRAWCMVYTEVSGSNINLDLWFAVFNGAGWGDIDSNGKTNSTSSGWDRLTIIWVYLYYQQEPISSQVRSKYQYSTENNKIHDLSFENFEYANNITIYSPTTWELASINPTTTYISEENNYILLNNTVPISYQVLFVETTNYTLPIEDISYKYLMDLDLETGIDWQENTSQTFDSITTTNEIVAYGSSSRKLVDTDNSTDTINITNSLPVGTAFVSVGYYIASLQGNFTFLYYNGTWQQFNLDNTSNRWNLFQDYINISDNSFSNIAFQLQGNGVIYIDGFRIYNTTMETYTISYDSTKISGYLRNWDSRQDPLLAYENITVHLKNQSQTLQTWQTETDSLAYFSVLSTYSFNAQQYHIEVITSTTSLTQNSSTTYFVPDYEFPCDYSETILHIDMHEGSGTNASDITGNGNHGRTRNGLDSNWTSNAINDSALDFEASLCHYLEINDSDELSFVNATGDTAFTWEVWINPASVGGSSRCIFAKWDHSTDSREYRFWLTTDGDLSLRLFTNDSDTGWLTACTDNQPIVAGEWHYLVATYNGGEQSSDLKLYINGSLASFSVGESGDYQGMSNGIDKMDVGRTLTTWYFDGIIDDVRLHKDLELSASDIAERFKNYTNYDYTQGEYYWYSSESTSKNVQQKSYFIPLSINDTVGVLSLYETKEYFLLFSFNYSLRFRTWSEDIYIGDYYVGQIISKNRTGGSHIFTYQAWTAGESYVYLPTAKYNYTYEFNEVITVFLGLSNQFGVGLPWETVKVYVNGTRMVFPFLNVLNNSKLFIEVYDYFDILLFNQTFTANRDNMEINIALTIFEVIFINEGDYPSEVQIYKNDTLGYNFTVYPNEVRTAMMIEGLYKYRIYYHEKYWIQEGEAGINEDIDTDPTLHKFESFRVTASLPTVVDASSPSFPTIIPDFIEQFAPWLLMLSIGLLFTSVTSALGLLWQYLVHRRTWAQRIDKGEIVWDPRRWQLYKQQLKR